MAYYSVVDDSYVVLFCRAVSIVLVHYDDDREKLEEESDVPVRCVFDKRFPAASSIMAGVDDDPENVHDVCYSVCAGY